MQNKRETVNRSVNTDGLSEKEKAQKEKEQRDCVYHRQGIRYFEPVLQKKIRETLDMLSTYHLHILETGELETILEEYDIGYMSDKSKWFNKAIRRIAGLQLDDINQESVMFRFISKIVGTEIQKT